MWELLKSFFSNPFVGAFFVVPLLSVSLWFWIRDVGRIHTKYRAAIYDNMAKEAVRLHSRFMAHVGMPVVVALILALNTLALLSGI